MMPTAATRVTWISERETNRKRPRTQAIASKTPLTVGSRRNATDSHFCIQRLHELLWANICSRAGT